MLKFALDPDVRKIFFDVYSNSCKQNITILTEALGLRNLLAKQYSDKT